MLLSIIFAEIHDYARKQTYGDEDLFEWRVGIEVGWDAVACEIVVDG